MSCLAAGQQVPGAGAYVQPDRPTSSCTLVRVREPRGGRMFANLRDEMTSIAGVCRRPRGQWLSIEPA
jgi:hypothetical protein